VFAAGFVLAEGSCAPAQPASRSIAVIKKQVVPFMHRRIQPL
jgi:hypothetical protein